MTNGLTMLHTSTVISEQGQLRAHIAVYIIQTAAKGRPKKSKVLGKRMPYS